jgi:hypothetical protein
MNNQDFLVILKQSFFTYLRTSPRSNQKLVILHGAISNDLQSRLGYEYEVHSLGINQGREMIAKGRYMDKKVDITITNKGKILAGLAVKFVMSNYSQNSNNYFEIYFLKHLVLRLVSYLLKTNKYF